MTAPQGAPGSGDTAVNPTPARPPFAVVQELDGTEHVFDRPSDFTAYMQVSPEWVRVIPPRVLAEFAAADPLELPHRGQQ